jgi:hypothetical protein
MGEILGDLQTSSPWGPDYGLSTPDPHTASAMDGLPPSVSEFCSRQIVSLVEPQGVVESQPVLSVL